MKCIDCGFEAKDERWSLVDVDIPMCGLGSIVSRCVFCQAWRDRIGATEFVQMPPETEHLHWCLNALCAVIGSKLEIMNEQSNLS